MHIYARDGIIMHTKKNLTQDKISERAYQEKEKVKIMSRKTMIKLFVVALAAAATIALAGCGSKQEKTYVVVTEPTFPPFDTTDDDGNIEGFDMDLLSAIAKDQGFKVKYKALEFDALIPAIQSNQADIIAAGMNALDKARQKKVDFSDTYYDSGLVLLVKKNNTTVKSTADLTPTMKVAGQIGTTSADMVNDLKKQGKIAGAVILNKNSDAILQLQNGDVDAVILDLPVANSYIKQHPGTVKKVGKVMDAESYGFAVKKGNTELRNQINEGLKNVKKDGTYKKLYKKWFESDSSSN